MPDRQTTDPSDLDVIAAVADGEREAFALLVERHGGSVRRLALAMTANDSTADDIVQETFISAWRAAAQFRGDASVRGWLLAIARNATKRAARRRSGEPAAMQPLDELARCAGWGATQQSDDFEKALGSRQMLELALSRLAAPDREILTVVDLDELSLREAADVLGLELSAVKSRLHRARLRLLAAVQEVSQ